MAGRSSGPPRQPLSQRRPKLAGTRRPSPNAAPLAAAKRKQSGKTAVPARRAPRGKESAAARQTRASEIYRRLAALYPDAHCELDFTNAYQLLVATILSAQCTDKRVNMVTPTLFARYPDAKALAAAKHGDVEAIIKSTGFFRAKAKSLIAMAGGIVDRHGGGVPGEMPALVALSGVGRKTANVVLGNAFDINEGVVVDTHVARLSQRLGLTREEDPVKIENALMALFPREQWTMLSHLLIWHGRRVCLARKPRCGDCVLADICPSAFRV